MARQEEEVTLEYQVKDGDKAEAQTSGRKWWYTGHNSRNVSLNYSQRCVCLHFLFFSNLFEI